MSALMKYKITDKDGNVMNNREYVLFGDGNIKRYCGKSNQFINDGHEYTATPIVLTRENIIDQHKLTQEELDLL